MNAVTADRWDHKARLRKKPSARSVLADRFCLVPQVVRARTSDSSVSGAAVLRMATEYQRSRG
jgi:hypothetical protein